MTCACATAGAAARPVPTAARLNPRDVELVQHLAAGRSTAQTAAAMAISTNTVRTRIRRVETKLAVLGRYGIVQAARQYGIV
jgi:DNA-binding CsgD family transcriptional regulator